jgi:hypothetical protein
MLPELPELPDGEDEPGPPHDDEPSRSGVLVLGLVVDGLVVALPLGSWPGNCAV